MKVSTNYFKNKSRIWAVLPPQKVSSTVKNTNEWKESNINAIISMAGSESGPNRQSRFNKQVNYDIVNSRFKKEDFLHVLNPLGISDPKFSGSPTKMQFYNLVRQPIETLKGEEMKLGMNFRAVAVNGEAVLEKNAERQKRITDAINARVQAIVEENIDPETGQPMAPDPSQVAQQFKTEYAHPTEIACNKLLKFLLKHDMLQMKFSKGWEHALVSSEEIYYRGVVKGHPSLRVCNPLNVSFDLESDDPFIHHGDWAMEERWMPRGAVIDLYGDYLTDKDIERLDNGEVGGISLANNGMQPGFAYDINGGMSLNSGPTTNTSHVYVANCAWRSWIKRGKLSFIDPRTGQIESTIVDDTFKMPTELKDMGAMIHWFWETEIWEGTLIGDNIYVNVRPLENQTGNLPYIGYIYNNLNSVATSIVDMIKPHQYTYIIVWYRLEQELAKAKGKKFVMDLAQLPKSKGWTVDQWMYYFDNLGVAWVNSMEEGRAGDPNSISKFNQFTSIDMTLSQAVGQYMTILDKIEKQVERITGVTPQRAGDISPSETATGAQRAIIQSTTNTKPLFFYHDIVREMALQELLELCKVTYIDGAEIEFALDEKTVETIKIDAGMLNSSDLSVFLSNSFEDAENIQKLESYLQVALQYDKTSLSDIVSVLGSKSMSEIKDAIVSGERSKIARDQEAAQANNESQMQLQQTQNEAQERKYEVELAKEEIRANSTIEAAIISAESRSNDGKVEGIEERKQQLAERKVALEEKVKTADIGIKSDTLRETVRSNKAKEAISKSKPTSKTK